MGVCNEQQASFIPHLRGWEWALVLQGIDILADCCVGLREEIEAEEQKVIGAEQQEPSIVYTADFRIKKAQVLIVSGYFFSKLC